MTVQASISFDAEYARVVKAVETAQARGDDFERIVNACMAALAATGITNDAPLDRLVARLAGERDAITERWQEAVTSELEDWGDGGETLRSGKRLRVFLQERSAAIYKSADAPPRVSPDHAAALQTQLEETQHECARLLAIVGTETPIAAFDLVTTWRTEKAGYMEEIATLRAANAATIEKLTLVLDEGSNHE